VVIDEAHKVFPQRSGTKELPAHVEFLAASGHDGITVVLITQGPKGLDVFVRERVGLHQNYRKLPMGLVNRQEWDHCSVTLKGPRTATPMRQPKWAYDLYLSATEHQDGAKPKAPWWLLIPASGLVLAVVAGPTLYRSVSGIVAGKGVSGVSSAALPASVPGRPDMSPSPGRPVMPGGPQYANASPAGASAQMDGVGCIVMRNRCGCISRDGHLMDVEEASCRWSAAHSGKIVPFDVQSRGGPLQFARGGFPIGAASAAPSPASAVSFAMK
jgi:hypothetical protein